MKTGFKLDKIIFRLREGDKASKPTECSIGGKWIEKTTDDFFKGKRVVLFSLPGAFTPTCSSQQLPCLLYTSPSPRDATLSRMPSSA